MFQRLIASVKKIVAFVRSILSERDGTGSASRAIAVVVAGGGVLALLVFILIKRDMPSADQLGGLAKVIGVGSFGYAANQTRSAVAAGNDPPAPETKPEEGEQKP